MPGVRTYILMRHVHSAHEKSFVVPVWFFVLETKLAGDELTFSRRNQNWSAEAEKSLRVFSMYKHKLLAESLPISVFSFLSRFYFD